jgi:phage recombination protein Bet
MVARTKQETALAQYTPEELNLIRDTLAKDLTAPEFSMFQAVSKATGLNIIMRQLYAVKRQGRITFQTSIDGFRLTAQRSKEYAGQQGPFWCGEDGEWKDVWVLDKPPVAAKVGVLRQGFAEPVWGVAKFSSYAQVFDGKLGAMWAKMPDLMIAKCAEALALRKAFPAELSGIYTSDEMAQADNPVDVTPSKLSDGARSSIIDMMFAMNWSADRQKRTIKKAEQVGDEAVKAMAEEYATWKAENPSQVAHTPEDGPQGESLPF